MVYFFISVILSIIFLVFCIIFFSQWILSVLFCLVLVFLNICVYLLSIELELLSLIYLLVQVGAVLVLFLFAILSFNYANALTAVVFFSGKAKLRLLDFYFGMLLFLTFDCFDSFDLIGIDYVSYSHLVLQFQEATLFGEYLYVQFFLYLVVTVLILFITTIGVIVFTLDNSIQKVQSDFRDRDVVSVFYTK